MRSGRARPIVLPEARGRTFPQRAASAATPIAMRNPTLLPLLIVAILAVAAVGLLSKPTNPAERAWADYAASLQQARAHSEQVLSERPEDERAQLGLIRQLAREQHLAFAQAYSRAGMADTPYSPGGEAEFRHAWAARDGHPGFETILTLCDALLARTRDHAIRKEVTFWRRWVLTELGARTTDSLSPPASEDCFALE